MIWPEGVYQQMHPLATDDWQASDDELSLELPQGFPVRTVMSRVEYA